MRTRWFIACAATTCLGLALGPLGCHALRNADGAPAGSGPNAMLDDVAVGQNRCPNADGEARPFVVEWDATDLATFEAKSSRDLVFVKYAGCEVELLYGCSDNGVPGRYGAYADPVFTSGTVESFEMRNQDELYAKLPLGAVNLSGKVEIGQTLELLYFVSGAVTSTRNYVERAVIADNGRCKGATHFVSAYNLGAFRLLAHEHQSAGVEVGVANAGGGSKTASESSNLKHGGDLDDCKTHSQQHCRVPIRLVLQPIDEDAQDLDASAAGAPRPDPEPAEDTVSERAAKLRDAAADKSEAGDGPGCLADLDRADALDDSDDTRPDSLTLRGMCTMLAGDCKAGRELLSEAAELIDENKTASDRELQAFVSRATLKYCPLAQLDNDEARGMATWTRTREARSNNQPAQCEANAEAAFALIRQQKKAGNKAEHWALETLGEASECLWSRHNCEAAKKWAIQSWVEHSKKPEAEARKEYEDIWQRRHEETGCSN
jgi:hypothetical protein